MLQIRLQTMAVNQKSSRNASRPAPPRLRAIRLPGIDGIPGLPLDGDAPERRRSAEPLSQTVARILGRRHIRLAENMDSLLIDWPELAGEELAKRIRPGKCENNILYLYVGSSADIFEIRRFKLRQLEARIRQHPRYRSIRQVRLQLDPGR